MSQDSLVGRHRLRVAAPMAGRDPVEPHRAATPLELFFDLVFVVAVALASERLHHGLAEGAVVASLVSFALIFFAIYWAWVNFTWFASAYDNDDVVFRLFVFVSMTGALIFAAGVPRAFDTRDFTVCVVGYAVMRLVLVSQWLRVAAGDTEHRHTARRMAVGLGVVQVAWIAMLSVPHAARLPVWLTLAAAEMVVPIWGESASPTTWHAEHIAERYGLFMIIVLGESVLAASFALQTVAADGGATGSVAPVVVGGLLLVFTVWWLYFDRPPDRMLSSLPGAFSWAYLHLLVFAAVAAIGAGLAVAIEAVLDHGELGSVATGMTVAIPTAVFLLSLWGMYVRRTDPVLRKVALPTTAVVVLLAPLTAAPVLVIGLAMAALLAVKLVARAAEERRGDSASAVAQVVD